MKTKTDGAQNLTVSIRVLWPGSCGILSSLAFRHFEQPHKHSTHSTNPNKLSFFYIKCWSIFPNHIKLPIEKFKVLLSTSKGHTSLVGPVATMGKCNKGMNLMVPSRSCDLTLEDLILVYSRQHHTYFVLHAQEEVGIETDEDYGVSMPSQTIVLQIF